MDAGQPPELDAAVLENRHALRVDRLEGDPVAGIPHACCWIRRGRAEPRSGPAIRSTIRGSSTAAASRNRPPGQSHGAEAVDEPAATVFAYLRRFTTGRLFKPFPRSLSASAIIEALRHKEVLGCTNPGNENPLFAGILEPSDGLEPSTPSLHQGSAAIGRNPRQRFWLV